NEFARQLMVEQREEQVLGVELGIAAAARKLLRSRNRFLRLDRQLREIHAALPSLRVPLFAIEHKITAVLLVNSLNVVAQLLPQPLDLGMRLPQLVLEPQHELDTREIESD